MSTSALFDLGTSIPTPPTAADRARWRQADRLARPRRLAALRERCAREGVDAYFGLGAENARYLTGIELGDGEEKVAGDSGRFFVSGDEVVVLADSRYREQAAEQCIDARIEDAYVGLARRWPELLGALRPIRDGAAGAPTQSVRRLAVEARSISHATWTELAAAEPSVELVPADGWVEELRATKAPAEIERIAAACAVADAALQRLLGEIRPGLTERELALRLEWEMRTHGADALAFDVACLSGPRAALPHGDPGERTVRTGEVLLFDFGAQVAGYRSDMTRTLFVGEPTARDLQLYNLVAAAQEDAFAAITGAAATGQRPTGFALDAIARRVIVKGGHGDQFGHSLGHGIGLATHELPQLTWRNAPTPIPSPTVFSVEPGVYLPGETGVRIEDLVVYDEEARRMARLTRFPREVTVVGA